MSVGAYAGMTNATAKINEAIDRVLTAGSGILWMPGSWNIAGQLSFFKSGVSRLNMKMLGVGEAIQLNSSLTNQIALRIGDGTNAVRDIEIGDLFLNHAGT